MEEEDKEEDMEEGGVWKEEEDMEEGGVWKEEEKEEEKKRPIRVTGIRT